MDIQSINKRFAPVKNSKTFNRILRTFDLPHKKVLDLGCGYGEYLVHFGQNSVGITSTLDEEEYGRQNRIDIRRGNVEQIEKIGLKGEFEAIWANNLFEHLLAPHAFLIKLKTLAKRETLLILGVPVIPRIASLMSLTKFRGALAGAHVNFFTRESLKLTVERAGWHVRDIRPFVFSNKILDRLFSFFAPHLYVVAYNIESFKYPDKKLKEWTNEPLYEPILFITKQK